MYLLKCFLDGELQTELSIEPGKELIIGRGDDVDIKLDGYPGISREHLKIIHLGDKLLIERLSQAGKLVVNGQSERQVEIVDDLIFSIPPYNFEVQAEKADASEESDNEEEVQSANDNPYSLAERPNNHDDDNSFVGSVEATSLSSQDLVGVIKRVEDDRVIEETPLEGHKWKFGRAKTNEFYVDYEKASRQHFEIFKLNDHFYVKDLGSSNGTYLNGHQLPANNEIELKTGDVISINEYKIIFEIHNRSHEEVISNLPEVYNAKNLSALGKVSEDSGRGFAVEKIKSGIGGGKWSNQTKIRAALVAALVIGATLFLLFPPQDNKPKISPEQLAAERRKLEEDKFIENAKIAALQYMDQANWSHCISEVQRIQEIRPDDPDASEIALRCQTAMEKLERQNQLEAQERERQKLMERVSAIIENCKQFVSEGSATLEACLQPAIELNPENEMITVLMDEAQRIDMEREAEAAKQAEYQKFLNAGRAVLKKADYYKDKEEWYDAIKWYNKYIAGKYPDPKRTDKPRAQRELASIRSSLDSALKRALEEALAFFNQENYKDAVLAARKGLLIDEYHAELKKIEKDSLNILRAEIRSLYQDSIIMEDLGKIHTAISKWKQIVEKDVPGEDYFKKATSKLRIYETEI